MILEIRVPEFEKENGLTIAKWLKETGDIVEKDESIAEVDTDKALITIEAPEAGRLEILVGCEEVENGQLLARLDTSFKPEPIKVDSFRNVSLYVKSDSFSVSIDGATLWPMVKCNSQSLQRTYVFKKGDKIVVTTKGAVWFADPSGTGGFYGVNCYEIYNQSYPVTNYQSSYNGVLTSNYDFHIIIK